jgi:hypothetical protein
MISPEMYRDQVAPYDEYVLRGLGGGGIHSCGRIEHNIRQMFTLPSIRCFDFGDPDMNDMNKIYEMACKRKIPLVRVNAHEEELVSGAVLRRYPTGVCLVHNAQSVGSAREVWHRYIEATEAK